VYYGIFLAGSKRMAKAEEYLQLGEKWHHLLPEEEAMLDRVLQKAPPVQSAAPTSTPRPTTPPAAESAEKR
jgi:hypothetical protein